MNKNKRYEGAIALIKSQTNYTEDEAKQKLIVWEGNYMNVIKEYLNPNFQKKSTEKSKNDNKSINEKMMTEIRHFMDDANTQFLRRKEEAEKKKEYLKKVYEEFLKKKEEFPDCSYNPPNNLSCVKECLNPMCPGFLNAEKKYEKSTNQSNVKL